MAAAFPNAQMVIFVTNGVVHHSFLPNAQTVLFVTDGAVLHYFHRVGGFLISKTLAAAFALFLSALPLWIA